MTARRTDREEAVLRAARQFARMKLHGAYVENGAIVRVCNNDRDHLYLPAFLRELQLESERLLVEMAIDEDVDGRRMG